MQAKTRRVISLIAAFALLVTCMISGLVLPVAAEGTEIYRQDFEGKEEGADSGCYTAGVPVMADPDGNKYIQVSTSAITSQGFAINASQGDWFRISFKVRRAQADKVWLNLKLMGFNDDNNKTTAAWTISWSDDSAVSTSGVGEWFTYNCYAKVERETSATAYLMFWTQPGNTYPVDIDDLEIEKLPAGTTVYDLNLLYGGDFNVGNVGALNGNNTSGLFADGGTIVTEPGNADNNVLHINGNGNVSFYQDVTMESALSYYLKTGVTYKLTYRQKGSGTTAPGVNTNGTLLATHGAPQTASPNEWKTVTAYYTFTSTDRDNIRLTTTGDVYLDDFDLRQVAGGATAIALPETLTLAKGASSTLEVASTPTNSYVQAITWSSNAESVATVENGVITAVDEGTATITATTADGLTDTCTVTVTVPPATGITLDKTAVTLLAGGTASLTVSADGVYEEPVSWTTSDATVATVADGVITAVGAGTATITVKTADEALSASCTVTVAAEEVVFEQDFQGTVSDWGTNTLVSLGGTKITVQTDDTNGYINCGSGVFSPIIRSQIVAGEWYRISFKARNNSASAAALTPQLRSTFGDDANNRHAYPQLAMPAATGDKGEWFEYTVYIQPSRIGKSWYLYFEAKANIDVDDVVVAKVRESGDLYGHNLLTGGDFENGKVVSLNGFGHDGLFAQGGEIVNVAGNNVLHVTGDGTETFFRNDVSLTADVNSGYGYYLKTNGIYKLTYRQKGEGTTALSVNTNNGTLLAVQGAPSTASDEWKTITAYYQYTGVATHDTANKFIGFRVTGDVYLDDFVLQEVPTATSFVMDETAKELAVGDTYVPAITMAPAGSYAPITWSTTAEGVAKIENGVIIAVGAGEATVTATMGDQEYSVTVTVAASPATDITLDKTAVTLLAGGTESLTALPNGLYDGSLVWTTSDATVATVADGVITAVGAGTATITVTTTSANGTLTASCTVTVATGEEIYDRDFESTVDWHRDTWNGSAVSAVTEDGNSYIEFSKSSNKVHSEFYNYVAVEQNKWYRVSFKVRNTGTSAAGFTVFVNNIFTGVSPTYAASSPEVPATGEWTLYNVYFQPNRNQPQLYLTFETADASVTLDLDDVAVAKVRESGDPYGHNLLTGGDFENGNVASLDGMEFDGLFAQGGTIVEEPDNADNKVLHMTAGSEVKYFYSDPVLNSSATYTVGSRLKKGAIYKLTYRQKGVGSTGLSSAATVYGGGTVLAVQGEPGKASPNEWKTVTAYYQVNSGTAYAYCTFGFQAHGDVYLDDFVLQEVPTATSFEPTHAIVALNKGESFVPEFAMTPANGYVALSWTSNNTEIVTVDKGTITAVGAGTTTVTVTDGTTTKTITVTVNGLIAREVVMPGITGGVVRPGDSVIFGAKIRNSDSAPDFTGSFVVEFRVNGTTVSTATFNGTIVSDTEIIVLADQAWTAVAGEYIVTAKITSDEAVHTVAVGNNSVTRELRVSETDLTIPQYAVDAGFNKLTFSDDFATLGTIDLNATGEAGYKWYVRRPYGTAIITKSDLEIATEDDTTYLHLALRESTTVGLTTIDYRSGEGFTFNKGYMEIRFRIPNKERAEGVTTPAIWSLPPEKLSGTPDTWVEMDWMEYWGYNSVYEQHGGYWHSITMHDMANDYDDTTDEGDQNIANGNAYPYFGLGDEQWHTMGFLWEEGKITAYLDGVYKMDISYSDEINNGIFTSMDDMMQALIIGSSVDCPMDVDYVRIWQAEEDPYLYADTLVEGGDISLGATGDMIQSVSQESLITVTAKPDAGYIMKPGSLKYVTADGTEVKILNKFLDQNETAANFGVGDGYTFQFMAPEKAARVTAEFIHESEATYAADTIGTAFRTNSEGDKDGIRFLTRLNLVNFDPTADALNVTLGGENYEIVEFGSLLMLASDEGTLSDTRYRWKSVAYSKDDGVMRVLDYTESYIDFTVVMTRGTIDQTTFENREYTARGYLVMEDADGARQTVLLSQLTNSAIRAGLAQ